MSIYQYADENNKYVTLKVVAKPEDLISSDPEKEPKVTIKMIDNGRGFGEDEVLAVPLNREELGKLISALTKIKTIMDAGEELYGKNEEN